MTLPPVVEVVVVVLATCTVAWLATYLLHSTLLVAGAALAERWLPLSAADRAVLWRLALFAPPLTAAGHVLAGGSVSLLSIDSMALASWLASSAVLSAAVVAAWVTLPWLLLMLPLAGWLRMRRALGTRIAAPGAQRDTLAKVTVAGGLRPATLTVSPRLVVPAALGTAEICLPAAGFDALGEDEQEALLAHELAHLARRDPLWLGCAGAVAQGLCLQPLNRIALRRLRRASEHAADDAAVRTTGNRGALARALAGIATALVALFGTASAAGSPAVERIARLLAPEPERRTPLRPWARGLGAAAVVLAVTFAGPGMRVFPERAGNAIPWLAPSKQPPNARMLEVRAVERAWRGGELSNALRDWWQRRASRR